LTLTTNHFYYSSDITPNIVRVGTLTLAKPEENFEIDEIIQAKNYSFSTKKK
jgi:hypothetical protein